MPDANPLEYDDSQNEAQEIPLEPGHIAEELLEQVTAENQYNQEADRLADQFISEDAGFILVLMGFVMAAWLANKTITIKNKQKKGAQNK